MDIQTIPIFSDGIFCINLDNIDNDQLAWFAHDLTEKMASDDRRTTQRDGGIQQTFRLGWNPEADHLIHEIREVGNAIMTDAYGIDRNMHDLGVTPWVNIDVPGHHHVPHTHPGAMYCCVYTVKCDTPTRLVFHRPNEHALAEWIWRMSDGENYNAQPNSEFLAAESVLHPEAGDLVFFPPYLAHSVDPYKGEGERITIAMNFSNHGTWKLI